MSKKVKEWIKKLKSDMLNYMVNQTWWKRNSIIQKFKRRNKDLTDPMDIEEFISTKFE